MPPAFLDGVVAILTHGLNTNSHKFALLRALADYGHHGPAGDVVPLTRSTAQRSRPSRRACASTAVSPSPPGSTSTM
jgi:hypothetical protein